MDPWKSPFLSFITSPSKKVEELVQINCHSLNLSSLQICYWRISYESRRRLTLLYALAKSIWQTKNYLPELNNLQILWKIKVRAVYGPMPPWKPNCKLSFLSDHVLRSVNK